MASEDVPNTAKEFLAVFKDPVFDQVEPRSCWQLVEAAPLIIPPTNRLALTDPQAPAARLPMGILLIEDHDNPSNSSASTADA